MTDQHPLLYTVREAATRLKVSPWTINKLIQRNQLGSIQIGARRLIPRDDVDAFVARLRGEQRSQEVRRG